MYYFFLENTLYMYIEFDNTCLAVSILTAFKIQKSISLEGMHNRRKDVNEDQDRVNLIVCLGF